MTHAPIQNIEPPPRVSVERNDDTVVLRYGSAAWPGKLLMLVILVAVSRTLLFFFVDRETILAELGPAIVILVGMQLFVIGFVLMRGFNVTTIRLSPTELTRRVGPFSLGRQLTVPRDAIVAAVIRHQRPNRTDNEVGLRVYNHYDLDVTDAENKHTTIKGSVRGRRHSLYLALMISETYDLRSSAGLRKRLGEAAELPLIMRLLVD